MLPNLIPFQQVVSSLSQKQTTYVNHLVSGLDGSARALMLAQIAIETQQPLLIVEANERSAQDLYNDLTSIVDELPVLTFPGEDSLALEYSIASFDNRAQRVEVLDFLASGEAGLVITTLAGARKRLSPPEIWRAASLHMEVGDDFASMNWQRFFGDLGYQREKMVTRPGEFSIRGGIIDFYPFASMYPVRLDFFDVELDSIRYFDAETQESVKNLTEITITPTTDVLLPLEQQAQLLPRIEKRLQDTLSRMHDETLKEALEIGMKEVLELAEQGEPLKYEQAYMEWLDTKDTSCLDYLSPSGFLVINELSKIQQAQFHMDEEDQFWLEQEIQKGHLLPGLTLKVDLIDKIKQTNRNTIHFSLMQRGLNQLTFVDIHAFSYRSMNQFFGQWELIYTEVSHWLKDPELVLQVMVPSRSEADRVRQLFLEHELEPVVIQEEEKPYKQAINIVLGELTQGFELPDAKWVVLTEHDLFKSHRKTSHRRHTQAMDNAERIKSYNELQEGDYVVHVNHGIGRYDGLETMEINGIHKDLLAITYQDNARVLIPVEKLQLIQKYVGSEGKPPKIHKLGGTQWQKTKQKVQATVEDIADELIELYAEREAEKGFSFAPDTPEQAEFENAFPYVETPDQLRSALEIKADMEKERPMDRLLVGDVGYGKTEVAMRAIFKALMDGKQVAFLVPTTILAQQHYHSLMERFEGWPFEMGLLSRFVPLSQQKETLAGLKNGRVSVVVGTHRLLSQDIVFQDLGLLIVDEEQRFGVKHKERLKQLKAQVDVLTLTATPIPRTLHMSMIGVRDLSVIETPPSNRFPVQTYVMERNEGAIKAAIEREMGRGGQCFYLYNRVSTIYQRAEQIQALVPAARVAVAHGQMPERELEAVLVAFIQGEYDVLVTTTIIETGIDIPNANTLFIDHADRMGLSTLYQLRGRVGRTHRVAYAYLMYDPFKQLTELSEKRLQAIREFTELGSGFKIAMRDLSIRGAGNLLGQQQSGFIDSVGYDLYSQMLKEAIQRKQKKEQPRRKVQSQALEWDVPLDAYLPASYIEDDRQKIALYKAIHQIDSEEAYRKLQDELIDRFGEFPDEVSDLLDVALIRHYALQAGIEEISKVRQTLEVKYNSEASKQLYGPLIFNALQDVPLQAEIAMEAERLVVKLNIYAKESYQWLEALIKLSRSSADVLQTYIEEEA